MIRARASAAAIASFLLSLAAPAAAAAPDDRDSPAHYELDWVPAPNPMPAGETWVREQAMIVETRLLPTGLQVADGPVAAADGRLLMGAGQQVLRLRAANPTYCNIRRGAAGSRASGKRICLIDSDGDGRFDSFFENGMGGDYWFALAGRLPERLERLAPGAAFHAVPAAALSDGPTLAFHYQRILDGGLTLPVVNGLDGSHVVRFHFKVGGEGQTRRWIVRDCRSPVLPSHCASANFPSQFHFAGLAVDLLERRGEDIRMRVVAPFDGTTSVYFQDRRTQHNEGDMFLAEAAGS